VGGFADDRDWPQKALLLSAIGTFHFAASSSDGSLARSRSVQPGGVPRDLIRCFSTLAENL